MEMSRPRSRFSRRQERSLLREAAEAARSEFDILERAGCPSPETLSLLAMGKRLLRGRFRQGWARGAMHGLEAADGVLLAIVPMLRDWCGEAVITARRK